MPPPDVISADDTRCFARSFAEVLRLEPYGALGAFVGALRRAADEGIGEAPLYTPDPDLPVYHHLGNVLASLPDQRSELDGCEFINLVGKLAQSAPWFQSYGGDPRTEGVARNYIASQLIGTGSGLVVEGIRAGLMLLAPNTVYPMHDHASDEVYYVVSGRLQITHGLGGVSYEVPARCMSRTPPGMPHALKIGDEAALVAWVWSGDVNVPSYWWVEEPEGRWSRFEPQRPRAANLFAGKPEE